MKLFQEHSDQILKTKILKTPLRERSARVLGEPSQERALKHRHRSLQLVSSTGEKSTFPRHGKPVDSLLKGTLSIKISLRRKGFGKTPIQSPERLMGLLCPRKGALPKTFFLCELFRKISSFPQTFLTAEKLISSQCSPPASRHPTRASEPQ